MAEPIPYTASTPIGDVMPRTRAWLGLTKAGFWTLGDLLQFCGDDYSLLSWAGTMTLDFIQAALAKAGLQLPDESAEWVVKLRPMSYTDCHNAIEANMRARNGAEARDLAAERYPDSYFHKEALKKKMQSLIN